MNMDSKFSEAATAAFTGHRFFDFSRKEEIKARLTACVLDAYECHWNRAVLSYYFCNCSAESADY